MPAPAVALALLTAPLPEPQPCGPPPRLAELAADIFDQGLRPELRGIQEPGGPFQAQQYRMEAQLADRFGDLSATDQVNRQLGRR